MHEKVVVIQSTSRLTWALFLTIVFLTTCFVILFMRSGVRETYALNQVVNYSFAGASTTSWSLSPGTVSQGTHSQVIFEPTSAVSYDSDGGSFLGKFSPVDENRDWQTASILQTYTASSDVYAKLRGFYRRTSNYDMADESGTITLRLYEEDTIVVTAFANSLTGPAAANDSDFTSAPGSGTWSEPVLLESGKTYSIKASFNAVNLDDGEHWGAYIDNIQLHVSPVKPVVSTDSSTTSVTVNITQYASPEGPNLDGFFIGRSNDTTSFTLRNTQTIAYGNFVDIIEPSWQNTQAYYVVWARDEDGQTSPYSNSSEILTLPGAPEILAAEDLAIGGFVSVSFSLPVNGAESYSIAYSTSPSGPWAYQDASEGVAFVSGLTDNSTYYFKAVGRNSSGNGPLSTNTVTAIPTDDRSSTPFDNAQPFTFTEFEPILSWIPTSASVPDATNFGASPWVYKDKFDGGFKFEGGYLAFHEQTATGANEQGTFGPGYYMFGSSQGPHTDDAEESNKCKSCHAGHRATGSSYLLRVDNPGDACAYCHYSSTKRSRKILSSGFVPEHALMSSSTSAH